LDYLTFQDCEEAHRLFTFEKEFIKVDTAKSIENTSNRRLLKMTEAI